MPLYGYALADVRQVATWAQQLYPLKKGGMLWHHSIGLSMVPFKGAEELYEMILFH